MNPTERFSDRVRDYVRYRPSYPPEVVELLRTDCGLREGTPVADVGAGTGIFSRLLLDAGAEVYAVEPNAPMREAAEASLGERAGFHSVAAPAQATTLPNHSVDLVTCAQAWHWFAGEETRSEFVRILKPGGWLFLVWNERSESESPFLAAYEAALKTHSREYLKVRHREFDAKNLGEVFAPEEMRRANFPNSQTFDLEGLKGRAMSSSYAPKPGDPLYGPFYAAIEDAFHAHADDGRVEFRYTTECYYGPLVSR